MALSGASMVFNDWKDYQIDLINRPDRAIPSKLVARPIALGMAFLLFLIAFLLASVSDSMIGICVALIIGASVAYTLVLKNIPLVGNVVVGIIAASPVWIWLPLTDSPSQSYLLVIASLMFINIGREIARTADDVQGDRSNGVHTVTTQYGTENTALISVAMTAIALALCWVPWLNGDGSWVYFAAVTFSTLYTLVGMLQNRKLARNLHATRYATNCRVITFVMALGCIAGIASPN